MGDFNSAGSNHYNATGSNTLTQITSVPVTLYSVSVTHNGGSVGYLQIYDNGTAVITAGTLSLFTIPVQSGTAGAGTPTFQAARDIVYPKGKSMIKGLSYLWAAGSTGTVAHGANAVIDITYN